MLVEERVEIDLVDICGALPSYGPNVVGANWDVQWINYEGR